jgi:hypothetical protein
MWKLRRKLIDRFDEFISELVSEKLKDFQPDVRSKKLSGLLTSFGPRAYEHIF